MRDEAGTPVSRLLLLRAERRETAVCLLLVAAREPHVGAAAAGELLELLSGLLSRSAGTGECWAGRPLASPPRKHPRTQHPPARLAVSGHWRIRHEHATC